VSRNVDDMQVSGASGDGPSAGKRGVPSGRSYPKWPGWLLLLTALILILAGASSSHRLAGQDEAAISEPDLVQAITLGAAEPASPGQASATSQPGTPKVQKTKGQDFCPT
jgi:hypothetical protein